MFAIRNTSPSWVKSIILMALSLVLVIACHQSEPPRSDVFPEGESNTEVCRTVQHALGEVCIPPNPQRIVILDEFYLLDNLTALGVKPVGYTPCLSCASSDALSKYTVDMPALGDINTPSLEKIVSLKPDLILGLEWQEKFYPLLSKIAPTVMIGDLELNSFRENLEYLAEVLDRDGSQIEDILVTYNEKVEEFRQQFAEKLKSRSVSVIGIHETSFYISELGSRIYDQVMTDVGIQFSDAQKSVEGDGYNTFSIEALPDWDADFLFVLQNYERHIEDLASMMEHPIWSTLNVVQNEKVHPIILDVWGPLTAIHFIDDLYQYFSEAL